jgi:hypothetical protein
MFQIYKGDLRKFKKKIITKNSFAFEITTSKLTFIFYTNSHTYVFAWLWQVLQEKWRELRGGFCVEIIIIHYFLLTNFVSKVITKKF